MSKHTPGPWEIVETTAPKIISSWKIHMGSHNIDFFPYVYHFADVEKTRGGYVSDPEMHANARLIAAAPELLEALENVISAWREKSDCVLPREVYQKAIVATFKAKGE